MEVKLRKHPESTEAANSRSLELNARRSRESHQRHLCILNTSRAILAHLKNPELLTGFKNSARIIPSNQHSINSL